LRFFRQPRFSDFRALPAASHHKVPFLILGAVLCVFAASPAFARPLENSDLPIELRDQNIAATLQAERLSKSPESAWTRVGVASYYLESRIFRRTATGERYDENAMTAAQRELPLGSKVKVTNLANGRSVVVRINDRPSASNPRVIDLARGAAARLDMLAGGVANVELALEPDNTPIEVAEVPENLDPPIPPRHIALRYSKIRRRSVVHTTKVATLSGPVVSRQD